MPNLRCPKCDSELEVGEGRRVRCANCGATYVRQKGRSASPPTAPAPPPVPPPVQHFNSATAPHRDESTRFSCPANRQRNLILGLKAGVLVFGAIVLSSLFALYLGQDTASPERVSAETESSQNPAENQKGSQESTREWAKYLATPPRASEEISLDTSPFADPSILESPEYAPPEAPVKENASETFRIASPSVCRVNVFDREHRLLAFGTGFFVADDGLLATNLHVITAAHSAEIRLPNGRAVAVSGVVAADAEHDLALLTVAAESPATLKLSVAPLEVGDRVYAIGNPHGLDNTLSEGIVSGFRRIDSVDYIQTTAPISPGSSGGPLLSPGPFVVGVMTMSRRSGQNLNLALPASYLLKLLADRGEPVPVSRFRDTPSSAVPESTIAVEDDDASLKEIWHAISEDRLSDGLGLLSKVPITHRGADYWMAVGDVHFLLDNVKIADEAYTKAASLAPENINALLKIGVVLKESGNRIVNSWERRSAICDRVIELEASDPRAYIIKAMTVVDLSDKISLLETATKLDKDNLAAWYNLGVAYIWDRRHEDAIKAFAEATRLQDTLPNYRFLDRNATYKLTEYTSTKSFKILLLLGFAKAHGNQEEHATAIKYCEKALEIEPKNMAARSRMAMEYRGMRKNVNDPTATRLMEGTGDSGKAVLLGVCAPPQDILLADWVTGYSR